MVHSSFKYLLKIINKICLKFSDFSRILYDFPRLFQSAGLSLALVHKHVKISVDEWIMETTRPHKHVQIFENQIFLPHMIISQLYFFWNYWAFQT